MRPPAYPTVTTDGQARELLSARPQQGPVRHDRPELEERGVYNTVLDMLYQTWRPLEDDRRYIANWCGCAVQKLNPIIARLLERGRLITFEEGGRTYISDEAFEAERKAVKGGAGTRSGRAQVAEKSGEVEEKSASVGQNSELLGTKTTEKQSIRA